MSESPPQPGWRVYGPLGRMAQLQPNAPALSLHDADRQVVLPVGLRPASGQRAVYVLQHVDSNGISDNATRYAMLANVDDVAVAPPLPPVWPTVAGWGGRVVDGQLWLCAVWDRPLRACNVASINWQSRNAMGVVTTVVNVAADPWSHVAQATPAPPAEPLQYRLQLTSAQGASWIGPWSTTVQPPAVANATLQTFGGVA